MLEKIFNRQREFEKNFFDAGALTHEERVMWTKEFVLCLHQELAEVMDSMSWKTYHTRHEIDLKNTKEEIIDCFKFILNLMIIWEIDEKELYELFMTKSAIVEERFMSNS